MVSLQFNYRTLYACMLLVLTTTTYADPEPGQVPEIPVKRARADAPTPEAEAEQQHPEAENPNIKGAKENASKAESEAEGEGEPNAKVSINVSKAAKGKKSGKAGKNSAKTAGRSGGNDAKNGKEKPPTDSKALGDFRIDNVTSDINATQDITDIKGILDVKDAKATQTIKDSNATKDAANATKDAAKTPAKSNNSSRSSINRRAKEQSRAVNVYIDTDDEGGSKASNTSSKTIEEAASTPEANAKEGKAVKRVGKGVTMKPQEGEPEQTAAAEAYDAEKSGKDVKASQRYGGGVKGVKAAKKDSKQEVGSSYYSSYSEVAKERRLGSRDAKWDLNAGIKICPQLGICVESCMKVLNGGRSGSKMPLIPKAQKRLGGNNSKAVSKKLSNRMSAWSGQTVDYPWE